MADQRLPDVGWEGPLAVLRTPHPPQTAHLVVQQW